MIEKIKGYFEAALGIVVGILAILLYRLTRKNDALEGELNAERANGKINDVLKEKEHAKETADDLAAKYRDMYERYTRGKPGSDV